MNQEGAEPLREVAKRATLRILPIRHCSEFVRSGQGDEQKDLF